MAYRRKGRPSFYFEARTETGRKQLSTGSANKALAKKIETSWEEIAMSYRAWDVLNEVIGGRLSIGRLYDLWEQTRGNVVEIRRKLADVDLVPLVEEWNASHGRSVSSDSAAHALAHVRHVFPIGATILASTVSPSWLSQELAKYPGKRNTIRKVHSSLSGFLNYCTEVRGLFAVNPMHRVTRPAVEASPIRFYQIEDVERIVAAQPTEERQVLFALLYGTGIEVSTALRLARSDVAMDRAEIRASGTKAHCRDRVCRVAEWAWPRIEKYLRTCLPNAPLFPPAWTRWTVSDWHRQTIGKGTKDGHGNVRIHGLRLDRQYPLHCARDHWAVRAARAGTPIALIQAQLGHGSPMLTLTKYARFAPSTDDRAHWEREATLTDSRRQAAK